MKVTQVRTDNDLMQDREIRRRTLYYGILLYISLNYPSRKVLGVYKAHRVYAEQDEMMLLRNPSLRRDSI